MTPELSFRPAVAGDLEAILSLLADDPLGSSREEPGPPVPQVYREAFEEIDGDPNNELLLAVEGDRIVGVLQITFIPGLSRRGARRALLEGVRVAADRRGRGVGEAMIEVALSRARARGCALAQLTSDKRRADALRFYERLGFEASHEGFKRSL